jgi:DNA-binding GntR family transcriptional regulator
MLPDLSVKRATTVERIADALREAMLSGELAPGVQLREVDLAEQLKVSRGSVREALLRLIDEGLARRDAFRSVEVTQLSASEVEDLFRVRKLIELNAVDAAGEATEPELAMLVRAGEAFAQAISSGTTNDQNRTDLGVHTALVALCGSPRLTQLHAGLMGELELALSAQYRGIGSLPGAELTDRHEEFIRLLRAGDTAAARAQLEQRLDLSRERLLRAVTANAIA